MKKLLLALLSVIALAPATDAKNLFINGQDYEVDTLVYKHQVGPGTTYAYYRVPGRPIDMFVLEIDLSNPYITPEVCNGGQAAVATERPTSMYRRNDSPGHDMVAAHNGDFYTTANGEAGISRMGLIGAGECIFNPPGTTLMVIDGTKSAYCDYVNFSGTVASATASTRIHTVNQLRLEWEPATQANQMSLFTNAFGEKLHASSAGGAVAVIRAKAGSAVWPTNTPLSYVVESVGDNPGQPAIPADAAVLYGVGESEAFLRTLAPGDELTINLGVSLPSYPDVNVIREAIGGSNHIILRNGEITNLGDPSLHPRTFMGMSQDKKKIYSVVIDGRYAGSAGIDLDDEGRVLQWLGATDGINLDGGGSSCMVVYGTQQNHPSDGVERATGNGVLYYSTAPVDDNIASLGFEPRAYRVPVTAKFTPAIFGYNQYGLLKTRDLEGVTLSCDPEVGHINGRGEFVAAATEAHGYIYAAYEGITARQEVFTVNAAPVLTDEVYVVDDRGEYPIRMSAPLGRYSYDVDPASVEWTVTDPSVCSVTGGYVRGIAEGVTTITGKGKDFEGTVTIRCEIPDGSTLSVARDFNASDWTLKQTGGTGLAISADGAGLSLDYTGNGSARGAYISLANRKVLTTYGLPKALALDINPGDATVSYISLEYTDARGGHGTWYLTQTQLENNATTSLIGSLDEIVDTDNNACYPIVFSTMRLGMGVSKKGDAFSIKIPRFEFVYGETEGVGDIVVTDGAALDVVATSSTLCVSGATGRLEVFDRAGACVFAIDVVDGQPVAHNLAAGFYIARLGGASAKFVVK